MSIKGIIVANGCGWRISVLFDGISLFFCIFLLMAILFPSGDANLSTLSTRAESFWSDASGRSADPQGDGQLPFGDVPEIEEERLEEYTSQRRKQMFAHDFALLPACKSQSAARFIDSVNDTSSKTPVPVLSHTVLLL